MEGLELLREIYDIKQRLDLLEKQNNLLIESLPKIVAGKDSYLITLARLKKLEREFNNENPKSMD